MCLDFPALSNCMRFFIHIIFVPFLLLVHFTSAGTSGNFVSVQKVQAVIQKEEGRHWETIRVDWYYEGKLINNR